MKTMQLVRLACAVTSVVISSALAACGPASAQQFPSKEISIITTVGPGSNFDQLARIFAKRLGEKLGVPVIVENVTGGQGIIATQRVLNAKSDGHTLLITGTGLATTPAVMKNAGYKAEDFVALAPLGQVPFILFVSSAVPATDVPSMIEYMKANREDLNSGVLTTSHATVLLSRKFGKLAGGDLTEIGYRSSPEMLTGLLRNDIQMIATNYEIAAPHLATGKIKAIGVVGEERTQSMPDLPTFKEKGYPLTINVWQMLFAKADLPAEIKEKIREASRDIVADQDYIKAMRSTVMEPWNIPFDSVQSVVETEAKAFVKDAQDLNVKFD